MTGLLSREQYIIFPNPRALLQVVMKLDVEGRELEVIPDMVTSGALAAVDNVHVDWTREATELADWLTGVCDSFF